MNHRLRDTEGGFTFAELAFGLLIFVIAAAVLINHLSVNYQTTKTERDRVFAYSKAQALLAEIQNHVDRGEVGDGADLDTLDDGVTPRANLTIQESGGNLLAADHVVSGNYQRNGEWVWARQISVQPFPGLNNRNVRYVTVRVFRRDPAGNLKSMADLSSVINASGSAYPTTQVFDVYFLTIENIPGWWVYMDAIQPFVESMVTDLETRNPGLKVRTHWIKKASYGRDRLYAPYINVAVDSWQKVPYAYYYPGTMPAGSSSATYYVPDKIDARMLFDGVETNGYDSTTNPLPYAVADYYNHAMRLPEERAYHDARIAAIEQREADIAADIAGGLTPRDPLDDMSKEPTLRLLLEDLSTSPDAYRNALVINLHGELLPMPAIRNFSDAARDPRRYPEIRVVTHPEELRTERDPAGITTDSVKFRTYAYALDPDNVPGGIDRLGPNNGTHPIAVEIVGVDLTDAGTPERDLRAGVNLERIIGGVMSEATNEYSRGAAPCIDDSPAPAAESMHYAADFIDPGTGEEKFTRILLYNTPVVAPEVSTRGVRNSERGRLYDMEYIPSAPAVDFELRDLTATGEAPKNTARWVLEVPATAFSGAWFVRNDGGYYAPSEDVIITARTRIWNDDSPAKGGVAFPPTERHQPYNLSTTYTWWADDATDVPITERAQFFGDPRHCPYKDLLTGDPDFGDGYNWFHDTLANTDDAASDYQGIDNGRLRNRWRGRMRCDIPRFFQLFREGLVTSQCLYTTLTGFSYYYVGHGAEIGYDSANGYPNSIPVEFSPFGYPGLAWYENNITGSRRFMREGGSSSDYWWGITWLGELFPDSEYSNWMDVTGGGGPVGNLAAGDQSGEFYANSDYTTYYYSRNRTYGTRLYNSRQITASEGCTSFFNIGSSSSTFHHQFASGNGNLVGSGVEMQDNYNFPMPSSAPISRPFRIDTSWSGSVGDEWWSAPYSTNRYSASMVETYYDHNTGATGSGLVQLTNPDNSSSAFIVVNGIDKTTSSGTSFIAAYSMLSMIHSYFEAGDAAIAHRIVQPPKVEIDSPTDISELDNPATIDIQWSVDWTRWDGLPYTNATSALFAENEGALEYVITYSRDGGVTWLYIQDDTVATLGELPSNPLNRIADQGAGDETYTWTTDDVAFPHGSYLLNIECYRQNQALHYAFHRTKIFIQR